MWTFALSLLLPAAFAVEPFSLEKKDQQVCRTQNNRVEQCLPTLKALGLEAQERLELIDRLKMSLAIAESRKANPESKLQLNQLESVGGAIFIAEETAAKIVAQYRRLSVRNIAVAAEPSHEDATYKFIPFFASLDWQVAAGVEGTLHVEGYLTFRKDHNKFHSSGDSLAAVRERMRDTLRFENLSGSMIESEEATRALLQETIGPMVFAEVVYIPVIRDLAATIAEGLGKAIGEALKKAFEGIANPPR